MKRHLGLTAGLALVVLGVGAFALSLAFEGGFPKGFFQGATLALVVLGVWALVKERRGPRDAWLPSRDRADDEPDPA